MVGGSQKITDLKSDFLIDAIGMYLYEKDTLMRHSRFYCKVNGNQKLIECDQHVVNSEMVSMCCWVIGL